MLKTYAPGFALIGALVAIAFQINQIQSAISPLALCVAFGFLVANFAQWPAFAAPATKISSKTIMRIGVALLGAQVSVVSLKEIGLKGVITVVIVVTFTIFGILGLSKLFKMSGDLGLLIGVGFGVCGATAVANATVASKSNESNAIWVCAMVYFSD